MDKSDSTLLRATYLKGRRPAARKNLGWEGGEGPMRELSAKKEN